MSSWKLGHFVECIRAVIISEAAEAGRLGFTSSFPTHWLRGLRRRQSLRPLICQMGMIIAVPTSLGCWEVQMT